jgi:hypothetical protein
MAQGTVTLFEEFSLKIADGTHDLSSATGTWKVALLSDVIGTGITAADVDPDISDYTQVTGGTSYTAGGETVAQTWTEAGGTATFEITTATTTWTQDASGPTNINTALIYDDSLVGNNAIGFMDMRDGGTTAISLQDGDITITWAANLFTLS